MNLSNVVTRIKMKLGLLGITTPFENLDELITIVLQDITIPVFSIYAPYKESLTINVADLELLDKDTICEKYLLPEFKTRQLLYVFDVKYDSEVLSGLGYYGGGMPLLQGNLIGQLMLSNMGANIMNQVIPKMTFHFERPRTLYLYNAYATQKIVLSLGFEHDKSMASIPETAREEFMNLALLDVKENMYPTLKQYTELNTVNGNINLKLDDWAQAEDQRNQLIEKWNDTYHLDFQPFYYI